LYLSRFTRPTVALHVEGEIFSMVSVSHRRPR
jgi:hypothetical protein